MGDVLIYPAHAGINLPPSRPLKVSADLPRTRGDKPANVAPLTGIGAIYPAHAGINLYLYLVNRLACNLPRTRGDKPDPSQKGEEWDRSTPHTRG